MLAKYVYAADSHGKLLILDGERGGVLGQYDTSAWQKPVANEWTDRIYFANGDGQILSLRPRDSRQPQVNKSLPVPPKLERNRQLAPPPPAAPPPAAVPPKEEEKKVEEKVGALRARSIRFVAWSFDSHIERGLPAQSTRLVRPRENGGRNSDSTSLTCLS